MSGIMILWRCLLGELEKSFRELDSKAEGRTQEWLFEERAKLSVGRSPDDMEVDPATARFTREMQAHYKTDFRFAKITPEEIQEMKNGLQSIDGWLLDNDFDPGQFFLDYAKELIEVVYGVEPTIDKYQPGFNVGLWWSENRPE